MLSRILFLLFALVSCGSYAGSVTGRVTSQGQPVPWCVVVVEGTSSGTHTDDSGNYIIENVATGSRVISAFAIGFEKSEQAVVVSANAIKICNFELEKAVELGEVVVTEISGKTILRENPLPVSVIDGKKIDAGTSANVVDVLSKNTPGLQVVKTGPNISKPFINGLGYNRVLTMVDGMRLETQQWGEEHGVPVDDYSVQKAEVVKGPASLLFGSDALGGVVSMSTFSPNDITGTLHFRGVTEFQTNNMLSGTSVMLMKGKGKWGWCATASNRIAGNFTNAIDGKVYNTGFHSFNGSTKIKKHLDNGFIELAANFHQNRQGVPDGSRDSVTRAFTRQVYEFNGSNSLQAIFDDIKQRPLVTSNALNGYTISDLSQLISDWRMGFNSRIELRTGLLTVNGGAERNHRIEYNHPTMATQPGMNVRLVSGQLRADYELSCIKKVQLNIGLCGMAQANKNLDATDFPIPDYVLNDMGGYLMGKWKRNKWTIAGGVRYDYRNIKGNEMFISRNPSSGFLMQSENTKSAIRQFSDFDLSFSGITGSLGATYKLARTISLKANVGKGYRAPNITEIASQGLDPGAHIYYIGNLAFKPEFNIQGDASILFNSKDLDAEMGAFYNTISGFIYQDVKTDASGNPVVIVPGNRTFQYQQTDADLMGGLFKLTYNPRAAHWFTTEHQLSCVYGFNRAAQYIGKGTQGEYLPFIPPLTMRNNIQLSWLRKNKILPKLPSVVIESEWCSAQNRYFGLYNTETMTASYWLVNLQLTGKFVFSKGIQVHWIIGVNNIADVAYQNHLSRLKYFEYYNSAPGGKVGIFDMGRNYCFKVILGNL